MVLEAYSATKPSLPYRGWLATALLLLLSTGLAAGLTWRRGGAGYVDRTHPAGWDISYRVPSGFVETSRSTNGNLYRYQLVRPDGGTLEISFWRFDDLTGPSASRVAERVLDNGEGFWARVFLARNPIRSAERMGGREAVQLADATAPMFVRAVALENGRGYAVALRVSGMGIDDEIYHQFELTCRLIEYESAESP